MGRFEMLDDNTVWSYKIAQTKEELDMVAKPMDVVTEFRQSIKDRRGIR